ncbi:hypothetical protein LJC47_04435 [Desulfosarcina sp. OttesenSCG-928-B08]|nr:hypothetical protein [Desulfosarcina sp. OttesenSCG-928-B08]
MKCFVKGAFISKPEATKALEKLEESPEDPNARDVLRLHLEAMAKENAAFMENLQKLLPASRNSGIQISKIENSSGAINIQIQGSNNTIER